MLLVSVPAMVWVLYFSVLIDRILVD